MYIKENNHNFMPMLSCGIAIMVCFNVFIDDTKLEVRPGMRGGHQMVIDVQSGRSSQLRIHVNDIKLYEIWASP